MPDEQDVFDAQLAVIVDAAESQCIAAARKSINSVSFATGRGDSAGAMDGNGIAVDRVRSPCIPSAIPVEVDIERAIALDAPDRSKCIRPSSGNSRWTCVRIVGAGVTERAYKRDQQERQCAAAFSRDGDQSDHQSNAYVSTNATPVPMLLPRTIAVYVPGPSVCRIALSLSFVGARSVA